MTEKKVKSMLRKNEDDKFRTLAEKNEYKIESLNAILDKEEQRRNQNANKMKIQIENYKKNMEYEEKLKKYQENQEKNYEKKKKKLESKLLDIERRVKEVKENIKEKASIQGQEKIKENKLKIDHENKEKCNKLLQKLKEEEENYETMKQQLIEIKKQKITNQNPQDPKSLKIEKVKLEQEQIYLKRKENLLIKFHHNEEVLKERAKEREIETERLK